MSLDIKVPVFPESVADGTLVSWHKKVGDQVSCDEVIAEIETDKVVFEVPAEEDGVITEIMAEVNAIVTSGQLIARMNVQVEEQKQVVNESKIRVVENDPKITPFNANQSRDQKSKNTRILMPAAAKLISENKLDANSIQGTGKDERVLKEDVIHHMQKQSKNTQSESVQAESRQSNQIITKKTPTVEVQAENFSERTEKRVPMSRLRQRIAERLLESQQTTASLTTFNEINMQAVIDLRQKYKDSFEKKHDVRLGFMSFFVKAAIEALKQYPDVNASVEDNDILYHGYFDIGIAVGSPRGLVVPVLKDADQLGFSGIESKISEFASRATDGSLSIDDITGGTFSITNGGVFGSLLSTPIINPPQSGILGLHKIEKRAVVENDAVVIRPMMYVALSYDHRLVDGRGAVQFLVAIKDYIEDPSKLLFDI